MRNIGKKTYEKHWKQTYEKHRRKNI
jgi:hypothetical protein